MRLWAFLWQNTKLGGYSMGAKILVLAGALGALVIPVLAHHSFGSEYDEKKPLKFENVTVTKLEWTIRTRASTST